MSWCFDEFQGSRSQEKFFPTEYLLYSASMKWILEKHDVVTWTRINLAQDMGQWLARLNTVINLRVPQIFLEILE
jgi:hypothetical protein